MTDPIEPPARDSDRYEHRSEGRVVLLDPDDRVLLIRVEDPAIDTPRLWITPGGGVEAGESPREAAVRELFEETGIRTPEVGPCVWRRRYRWRWGDRLIESDTRYFLHRLSHPTTITWSHASDLEHAMFRENRWWSLAELSAAEHETFSPRRFGDLLAPVIAGELTRPLTVSDD